MRLLKIFGLGILLCFLYLFVLVDTSGVSTNKVSAFKNATKFIVSDPVIMVPGTGGTTERFNDLLARLKQEEKDLTIVKIEVNKHLVIRSEGKINANSLHPVFVIAFEDNSDEALPEQGKWYQKALNYIQETYGVTSYDFLGHSNGGLVITQYLENHEAAKDPILKKIITLGTPFNDISDEYNAQSDQFDEPKAYSEFLQSYLNKQDNISSKLKMINIAGEEDKVDHTDGTVPVTSVLAGRLLYDHISSYKEMIIKDDASHSSLVDNPQVIDTIHSFFWNGE